MAYAYVDGDGKTVRNTKENTVYVRSESDLAGLADVPPGTVAIEYGYGSAWHLKPDGTWEEI